MGTDAVTAHVAGPADDALVDALLDAADRLWERAPHVTAEDRMMMSLALSEIATNIARHSPRAVQVEADLSVDGGEVRAVLADTAPPAAIDWDAVRMPDDDAESGRGLALALRALDALEHEPHAVGNRWTLVRALRG
ncbi:ATP-binding protein [Microbacterium sp. NPDC055683]